MTRFELENQQIQVRIAEALEAQEDTLGHIEDALEVIAVTLHEKAIHEGYMSRTVEEATASLAGRYADTLRDLTLRDPK